MSIYASGSGTGPTSAAASSLTHREMTEADRERVLDTAAVEAAAQREATRSAVGGLVTLGLAGAVVSVVLGVIVIAWPAPTLAVCALLLGAWLAAHGVMKVVHALSAANESGSARLLTSVVGLIFIGVGVVFLRQMVSSLVVLVTLIGVCWLMVGLVELVSAWIDRRPDLSEGSRGVTMLSGGLSVLAALFVLAWPGLTLLGFTLLTGAWLVAMGLVQAASVLYVRRRVTAGPHPAPR